MVECLVATKRIKSLLTIRRTGVIIQITFQNGFNLWPSMNSKSLYSVLLPETIYSMHVYCCSTSRSLKISTLKERKKKWSRGEKHEKDAGWGEKNNKGRRSVRELSRREKLPVGVLQTNKCRGTYINVTAYTALHFRDVWLFTCCWWWWCFRPVYRCVPLQFPRACATSTNTCLQQRLSLLIFMSINGRTTEGESLTGVQISEEGLIQGLFVTALVNINTTTVFFLVDTGLCFTIQELIHILWFLCIHSGVLLRVKVFQNVTQCDRASSSQDFRVIMFTWPSWSSSQLQYSDCLTLEMKALQSLEILGLPTPQHCVISQKTWIFISIVVFWVITCGQMHRDMAQEVLLFKFPLWAH